MNPPSSLDPMPTGAGPNPHFRAFWVDAFHPGIKSPAEVDQLIHDVQAANANAVIVQVRRRADAYYNRTIEPRSPELQRQPNYDPLAYLIERAHATVPPIAVHAWLAAMPIATVSAPPSAPEHVYFAHGPAAQGDAMWLSVAFDGTLAAEDTYSLDPGHPGAAQYIVDVTLNLVRNYAVDGIHLDRIRYAGAQFGYNPISLARYAASRRNTDAAATPAPNDLAWQGWRRDQVTHLMRQIYLETVALKPEVVVTAATIPWGAGPTSEIAWLRGSAMTGVFQDWRGWLREGILDMAIPMNYDREADARQRAWFDAWIEWEKNQRGDRHLAIGVGAFLNDISDTLAQARRALAPLATGQTAQGIAFYSYAAVDKDGSPREALFRALAATDPDGLQPIFAAPVPTPEMPWKSRPAAGYLKGTVRYANGRPGDVLTVALSGPAERALTVSGTGFYGATELPPGTYALTVTHGREVMAVELTDINVGQVATLDITL